MYQKFLNKSIMFRFIGKGQVDIWHHLTGLLEPSSPRNPEKILFRTSPKKFTRLCEVENASTRILSSWSISHDCAKISHGHTKSIFTFPLVREFFACLCEIEKHGFSTPFCNLSHFFILIPLQLPPNPNPNWLHCFFHYAFGSSSTLFVFFNLIHLFCYQFIKNIPWNDSKTS